MTRVKFRMRHAERGSSSWPGAAERDTQTGTSLIFDQREEKEDADTKHLAKRAQPKPFFPEEAADCSPARCATV